MLKIVTCVASLLVANGSLSKRMMSSSSSTIFHLAQSSTTQTYISTFVLKGHNGNTPSQVESVRNILAKEKGCSFVYAYQDYENPHEYNILTYWKSVQEYHKAMRNDGVREAIQVAGVQIKGGVYERGQI